MIIGGFSESRQAVFVHKTVIGESKKGQGNSPALARSKMSVKPGVGREVLLKHITVDFLRLVNQSLIDATIGHTVPAKRARDNALVRLVPGALFLLAEISRSRITFQAL
jgi:hypothetical protein